MNESLPKVISTRSIILTSLLIVSAMISYFFLMKLLNLETIVELRYFNTVIIFFGVRHVLYRRQVIDGAKISFHVAVILGFITTMISSFTFSLFLFIYLNIDLHFLSFLKLIEIYGIYLSPAACAFVIFLEGIITGTIIAIPAMITLKARNRASVAAEHLSQLAN